MFAISTWLVVVLYVEALSYPADYQIRQNLVCEIFLFLRYLSLDCSDTVQQGNKERTVKCITVSGHLVFAKAGLFLF